MTSGRRAAARWIARLTLSTALAASGLATAGAQTAGKPESLLPPQAAPAPTPTPAQSTAPVAPPPVTPTAPATVQALPPPVPLPQLSPAQSAQLAAMLGDGATLQGLRAEDGPMRAPAGNDALVLAALDYARAVHAGRLAESDFMPDWGLRPPAYDPLPGFADAVKRDRLARWIASLPPPYSGYDGLQKGLTALSPHRGHGRLGAASPLAPIWRWAPSGPRVARAAPAAGDRGPADVAATGDNFDLPLKRSGAAAHSAATGSIPTGVVSGADARRAQRAGRQRGSARSWPTWSAGAGCRASCRPIASR